MIKVMLSDPKTIAVDHYLWDQDLTYRAKGIIGLLMSFPERVKVSEEVLIDYSSKEGKAAIRSALKELIEKGYLVRNQLRNEHSKLDGMAYILYPETIKEYERRLNERKVR